VLIKTTIAIVVLSLLVLAAAVVATLAWRRSRRIGKENARLGEECQKWANLAALGNDTNYRLACQIHGKAQVDRAIAKAQEKGGIN
jgi:hypothetical protein